MAVPVYECVLVLPGGERLAFEERDPAGAVCAACPEVGLYAEGPAREVIAAAAGLPLDDDWVLAATAAVERERRWAGPDGERRDEIRLARGHGEKYHVTAAVNRDSIGRYGLDWRRMGAAPGVTGGVTPELAAIFLCDSLEEASFFLRMTRAASDVWGVHVDGIWLENGPDGWLIVTHPLPPARLRLVGRDEVIVNWLGPAHPQAHVGPGGWR